MYFRALNLLEPLHIFYCIIILLFYSKSNIYAQIDTLNIRSIVLQQVDTTKTIGLVVGIIKNEKQYIIPFGRLDKEKQIMPDSNTVFEIGGITKIYTAALITQLKAQQKLDYEETVLTDLNGTKISLYKLLTHTSGLPNLPAMYAKHTIEGFSQHDNYTYDDLKKDMKICISKNNKYLFSQYNYAIIGSFLQDKMNENFETLIQSNLLLKYNLKETSFEINTKKTNAFPYDLKGDKTIYTKAKAMNAALGLRSSMSDLLNFILILMKEKNDFYKNLFEIKSNTNNNKMKSCFGFHAGKFKSKDNYFYITKGRTDGFYSFVLINTELNFAVCILANGSSPLDELAYTINDKLIEN